MRVTDETRPDLERLIALDLGPAGSGEDFRTRLTTWLHYLARRIPPRPREVLVSDEVRTAHPKFPAVSLIERDLMAGADVSPWLSRRVRDRKTDLRADLMFNDWQVSHFHLGRLFETPTSIKRAGPLLFAFIKADRAVLLDVQPHRSWTMKNLLRILLRVSPDDMLEVRGILGPSEERTEDEIFQLRNAGMNSMLVIDGRSFISPGIGLSSARTAVRITRFQDRLTVQIDSILNLATRNALPPDIMMRIAGQIGLPFRLGVRLDQDGTFVLFEKCRMFDLFRLGPVA